jgi:hypothetical protein
MKLINLISYSILISIFGEHFHKEVEGTIVLLSINSVFPCFLYLIDGSLLVSH